jgi:hypothetical protein
MADQITWAELNSTVLEEFPELNEKRYLEIINGFDGWYPGPYVVFGSLFNQYLRDAIFGCSEARSRVGAFLERMALARNGHIED